MKNFYSSTIHSAENTDNPIIIKDIFETFELLSSSKFKDISIAMPMHPVKIKCFKSYNPDY